MCGIFGLLGKDYNLSDTLKYFETIRPRGPDRSKIIYTNDYFLGFHRLAINGLDFNSDQPFIHINDNKTYIILVNGEIYNSKDLIKKYNLNVHCDSDCAVIYPLFKHFNYDFKELNKCLNGEYAISIIEFINDKYNKVYLSTDPSSVRPLFYSITKQYFSFSSLLAGLCNNKELYNIQRLDQGKYLIYDFNNENCLYENYHEKIVNFENNNNHNLDNISKQIVKVLNDCIIRRLQSDRPIGCLLSGGLDSSLVCALTAKHFHERYPDRKLRTFSIGMEKGTDIKYAEMVANHLNNLYNNIDHTTIYFTPEEGLDVIDNVLQVTETWDITTVRASVGQYLLGKYISQNTDIKVILNGDGADEAQMGYLYFYNYPDLKSAQEDHYRLLDNIHYFDGLRVDRNISYHGLEARVPFLDKEFVDLFRSLESSLKVPTKDKIEKYLIRKSFELYEPNLLPHDVLWRKKEAFSDGVSSKEKSWFQIIKDYMDMEVGWHEFEVDKDMYHIEPKSKESYYYLKKFYDKFNGIFNVIPYYWLPKWSGDLQEPSARVLNVYETTLMLKK